MTAVLDTETQWMRHDIGPRVEDGVYLHGSYGETYTVLNIRPYGHDGMPWSMDVRWESGAVTTHCTPWNSARGDRELTQMGASA